MVTPLERRRKNPKIRREFSYLLDVRGSNLTEERPINTVESTGKRSRENINKRKKNMDRANNQEKNSNRKKQETEKSIEKNGNNLEL